MCPSYKPTDPRISIHPKHKKQKKNTPRHMIIKFLKSSFNGKILTLAREKDAMFRGTNKDDRLPFRNSVSKNLL